MERTSTKLWEPLCSLAATPVLFRSSNTVPVRLLATTPNKASKPTIQTESKKKNTIGGLLREVVQRSGHRDALLIKHAEIRYTWIELGKAVWSYADGFEGARCFRGDRIINSCDSDTDQVLLPLASSLADVVYSPVPPTATKNDLEHYFKILKPKLFVFPRKYRGSDRIKLLNELIPELSVIPYDGVPLRCKKFPSLRYLLQVGGSYQRGIHNLSDIRWVEASPSPLPAESDISSSRPAFVYWHGDKPVTFDDAALVESSYALAKHTGLSREDRVCVAAPFHTPFAFASGVLPCLHEAAITVIPGSFFLPDMTLKCLARDSVSRLVCLPEQLEDMLKDPSFSRHDLSNLTSIVIGVQAGKMDAPALAQLLERTRAAFKVKNVLLAYYHPQVAGAFAISTDGESAELLPGVQAKVSELKGSKGEILLKSSFVAGGLWNSENNQPEMKNDGWLRTAVAGTYTNSKLVL